MIDYREHLRVASRPALARIADDRERVDEEPLREMLEHIARHLFNADLNVETLKLACGIRDNTVAVRFHKEVGAPPHRYIFERRMETAARLLRTSGLRIWRIADLVGYRTINTFSRAFKRWSGFRPKSYRKRLGQAEPDLREFVAAWHDPDFQRRVWTGRLADPEAAELVKKLLEVYPGAGVLLRED